MVRTPRTHCQTSARGGSAILPRVLAAIVAVGSELLSTDRLDTNSLQITALLERHAVELQGKSVVGDDLVALAAELRHRLDEVDLVVVCGGLGPTADDVTREAAAAMLGRELIEDPEVWARIERRFRSFGRVPSENNRRQAQVIAGGRVLPNRHGTAPGMMIEERGKTLVLMPGVPFELTALLAEHLEPWLAERSRGREIERVTLRTALRPESEVDRALEPAYRELGREGITLLASPGEVKVRLEAAGTAAERQERLAVMERRLRELLGAAIYGRGESPLEAVVGELLATRGATLAVAESCTGGLLAERLTRVPGSSRYFPGGLICYSDAAKQALAGVPADLLARYGAVSEPVARALAMGARERFAATYGVGITGIAGPGGGSAEKPAGTVHVAVAAPGGSVRRHHLRFPGDRERVRTFAATAALELVRRLLLDIDEPLWSGERPR